MDKKELLLLESLEDFLNDPELNSLVSTAVSGSTINDPTTYAGSGYLGAANKDLDQDILKRRRDLGRKIKRLWAKHSDTSFFQNELAYFHYSSAPNLQNLVEEYNSKSEISTMAIPIDDLVSGIFPYTKSYYGPLGVRIEGRVTLAANNMDCVYSGHYKKQETGKKDGVKKCSPLSKYPGYLNPNTVEKYIFDKNSYDRTSAYYNEAILDNSRIVYAFVSSMLRFHPNQDDNRSRWTRSTDYLSDILSLLSTCKSEGVPLYMYFDAEIKDLTKLSYDEEKVFLDTAFQLFVEEGTSPPSHSEYPDYVNRHGDIEFTSTTDSTTDEELANVRQMADNAFYDNDTNTLKEIANGKYVNDSVVLKYLIDSGFSSVSVILFNNPHLTEKAIPFLDSMVQQHQLSDHQESLFMSFKNRILSEQVKRMVMDELNKVLIEGKKDACYHKVKSRYKKWPSAYASGALVKCRKVGAKNWGESTNEAKKRKYRKDSEYDPEQLKIGIEHELEHIRGKKGKDDYKIAKMVAKDHLGKDPEYYKKLKKAGLEETKKKAGTESSKEKNLRDWFKRKGAKGKTGGWVDCNTCRDGKCKPCGRQEGESRAKYPACRPTPGACKEKGRGKTWGKTSKKS